MNSQVKQYTNTISATLLSLTMIIKGAVAGFFVCQIISIIIQLARILNDSAAFINELSEYGSSIGAVISIDEIIRIISVSRLVIFIILSLGVICMVLNVMDAIAVMLVRYANAGASTVKGIHLIYMIVDIIDIVLFAFFIVQFIMQPPVIDYSALGISPFVVSLILIITAALIMVVLVLRMCFQKDIVRAMSTVNYEIKAGRPGPLKKTHLSGISFIYAVVYSIAAIAVTANLLLHLDSIEAITIITAAVLAITAIRYYTICFCNRNLKYAR